MIAAQVVAERRRRSLTRDELAAAAQEAGAPSTFTASALRNVETGRRGVTVDELVQLAAALDVSPRDLLGEYARLFGQDAPTAPIGGEVEAATRKAIEDLGDLDGIEEPLAAIALADARALDDGAGMATAAVSKELRAALTQLWEGRDGEDEDEAEDYGPT
ncbi:helix-turn-helix domain-containing protein [Micromonospora sp. NBC_01655]|uniref:helix-turn-helix domain-containing protein n=1 Tax=Micromonospora sp. NBC_01655 TaxID=2975983 RepID=UPI002251F818|nr:helix-turn-helix transcriptional regulator [Micromonospora sp. NBC_01655]MCX4468956.1 helix-turn-helix domain-containing protein [Micromonospora sp. NBC_01655]